MVEQEKNITYGKADLDIIKKVKEAVKIPVIGNGDIVDVSSAKKMFEYTGCDGIMIARGAQGNPWIFKSILEGKDYTPTVSERFDVIFKHIAYALEFEDQRQVNMKMRKHIAWYLKGLEGSTKIKDMVNRAPNVDEVKKILKNYQLELEK